MPLKLRQVKKKSTKTTASNKKKQPEKKRGPKISPNYFDISEYKYLGDNVTLNRLRYNHIIHCNVKSVRLIDGIIQLEDSWVSLIALMLDTVRVNNPDRFLDILMENEITTQQFCVDKTYGKYSFDEIGYIAYKLFNSGYYLEAILNTENIFWSIIKLSKCLGIALDEMSLELVNKNSEQIKEIELEETTAAVKLHESIPFFKNSIYLVNMEITKTYITAHNIETVLFLFCNYVYDMYGEKGLKKLSREGDTHIITSEKLENNSCMEIKHSGIFVYSNCEAKGIINFIANGMDKLGMDKNDIKLYFRNIKKPEEKKIWEVD